MTVKSLLTALMTVFILAIAIQVGPAVARKVAGTEDIYRRDQALELEQKQRDLELQQQKDQATAPGEVLSFYLLITAVAAAAGLAGAIVYQRMIKSPLVKADEYGRLPIARSALANVQPTSDQALMLIAQSLQLAADTQIAQARAMERMADHMSLTIKDVTPAQARPELPVPALAELDAPAIVVPSFKNLLEYGKIGGDNGLLLGFTADGNELRGSWKDLYSTALGGLPGTGKTTSQRFFAAQTAMMGAKFAVIDPHADAGEDSLTEALLPLSSRFICEPASETKSILDTVKLVADMGKRRIEGDKDRTPIILWVDECTSLLSRTDISKELAELLERIAQEYRKVGVYASLSGQIWTAKRAGGTELRDSLASVICHRMKVGQAQRLLSNDDAKLVERLPAGQAVLWRTSGLSEVITIPNTTAADLVTLEGQWKHRGSTVEAPSAVENSLLQSLILQSPDDALIIESFKAGKDISAIAREVSGATSGRKYSDALESVNGVIRQVAMGKAA